MKKILKFSGLLFILLFTVILLKQNVSAKTITYSDGQVSPDKVWQINFNQNVENSDLNLKNIYVNDEFGNSVSVTVSLNVINPKQILVKPPSSGYVLGKSYKITVNSDLVDVEGKKLSEDTEFDFTVKKYLIDTADFKVAGVESKSGFASVAVNVTSPYIKSFWVEGEDEKDSKADIDDKAYIELNTGTSTLKNVNVYFYDKDGKQVGNCIINVEKSCNSQVVQIKN